MRLVGGRHGRRISDVSTLPAGPRRSATGGRMRKGTMLLPLLAGALTSCSSPLAADLSTYEESLRRWEAAAIHSYTFRYELNCFCGGPGVRPVEIEVRDGSVFAVSFSDGEPPEPYALDAYPTVPDLFHQVRAALDRKPFAVRVEYDGVLGYPREFFADFLENAVDEELGFQATDLVPAPD